MAKALHAPRYRRLPGLFRELRETANLTQRDLAQKLRIDQSTIHKTETGERRADISEFLDWCLACGADPELIFKKLIESMVRK